MNELERFCAETPPPSSTALAEGRRLLLTEARGEPTAADREKLGRTGPAGIRPRRAFRLCLAGGLAAAAVTTGAIVVAQNGGDGAGHRPAIRPVSAVEVLSRAAASARAEHALNPRDDQFVHVKAVDWTIEGGDDATSTTPRRTGRELWLSVNGRRGDVLRVSPCTKDTAESPCTELLVNGDSAHPAWNDYAWTPKYLLALPTDPQALRARIEKRHGSDGKGIPGKGTKEESLWDTVSDLIGEQYVPPKVRGAMFDMLAKMSGVTVVNDAADAVGRHGIAVAMMTANGTRKEMIFDKTTYRYLGEREVVVHPHPSGRPYQPGLDKAGTVLDADATLSVDITDGRPAGRVANGHG